MKYFLTVIIVSCTGCLLQAQQSFIKKFTDFPQTLLGRHFLLKSTPSGKTFFTFPVNKSGIINIGLVAYDAAGNQLLSMVLENSQNKEPWGLAVENNNVVITGRLQKVNGRDGIFVIKTDTLGNLIWYKTYGNEYEIVPRCVAVDKNGNVAIGGSYNPWEYSGQPSRAFFLILNGNGGITNFQAISTTKHYAHFSAVTAINEGGFLLSGQTGHLWDYYSALTVKVTNTGSIVWLKAYRMEIAGGNYNLWSPGSRSTLDVAGVTQISASRFLLTGYSSDHDQYGTEANYFDGLTLVIDKDGNLLKGKKHHNGPKRTQFNSAKYFDNGTVGITAYTQGADAAYFMLADTDGNIISDIEYKTSATAKNYFYSSAKTNNKFWISGISGDVGSAFPTLTVMDFNDRGCNYTDPAFSTTDIDVSIQTVNYATGGNIQEFAGSITTGCLCENTPAICGVAANNPLNISITAKSNTCTNAVLYAQYDKNRLKCPQSVSWVVNGNTIYADSVIITDSNVNVSVQINAGSCTFKKDTFIKSNNVLTADLGPDQNHCDSIFTTMLNPKIGGGKYLWSTGDTTEFITVKKEGVYFVTVKKSTCTATDTIQVNYINIPKSFGPDESRCIGDSILLTSALPGAVNVWSTGQATSAITVKQTGIYILTTTDSGCQQKDTIKITFRGEYNVPDIDSCAARPPALDAGNNGATYLWSTGETTRYIKTPGEGNYWVKITLGSCEFYDSVTIYPDESDFYIHIPSAITPSHSSGLNDVFKIEERGIAQVYLIIFDRWGEIIYTSQDKNFAWDGTYKDQPLPDGVYYYELRYRYHCGNRIPSEAGPIRVIR